jgi:hypothetical protein
LALNTNQSINQSINQNMFYPHQTNKQTKSKYFTSTKSKLQMEFNKEVTSASSGLVYVCFGSFVKCSRV